MDKITISEINRYHSFFKIFDFTFNELKKNLQFKLKVKRISWEKIGAIVGENRFRSYTRARSGLIRLDQRVFAGIIRTFRANGISETVIGDLTSLYETYLSFENEFTAKKNNNRGTNYFSAANIDERFRALFEKSPYSIADFIDHDATRFHQFVDDNTELHFSNNETGRCITNCYVISEYMARYRDSEFQKLDDTRFAIRLSFVARVGAWACQSVGQRYLFLKFIKTLEEASKTRSPQTVIGLSMARYHGARWDRALGQHHVTALKQSDIAFGAAGMIGIHDVFNEVSVALLNASAEALNQGATSSDRLREIGNRSVESLMSQAYDIKASAAFDVGSTITKKEMKARSLANDGKLASAVEEIEQAWNIYYHSSVENDYYLLKLYITDGIIKQKMSNPYRRENESLRSAFDTATRIGAFQHAYEVAELMGWQ